MKNRLTALAAAMLAGCFLVCVAMPVQAQRAALTRDQDNPDLAPFSMNTYFQLTSLNTQQTITTVPAGKRLVIDHISYSSGGVSSDQLVYLSMRVGTLGAILHALPINAPHVSVTSGYTLQDGSFPIKIYYEAGQDVVVSASHQGGSRDISLYLTGHWITP